MVNKTGFPSLFEKLLHRFGRWYPPLTIIIIQVVNTPLLVLLTVMPAQTNAEFSPSQGTRLLIFGSIALLFRNIFLLFMFFQSNKDFLFILSKLLQPGSVKTGSEQEKRAWNQVSSASKTYILFEFIHLFTWALLPTLIFGYFKLNLSVLQMIYLSLAVLAAGLVNAILANLTLDQWFEPVIRILLPRSFEEQLDGLRGMRLGNKLFYFITGLALISLLLLVPTAFHQISMIYSDETRSPQNLAIAADAIFKASMGAIIVGLVLTFRLTSYFYTPFRKMIDLFRDVEAGDLSRRIDVTYSDEFGKVNIYLNHMIERLQLMTATLEQQVEERTAQLSQVNEQLQVELSERIHAQEQLVYSALHDPLTGIPNRALFMDRLRHVMDRAGRHMDFTYAVLFMDLDHFKVVNDSLGHSIGDLLLVESARRMNTCIRREDTVARLGGDEFVILLEELEAPMDYIRVADRIQHELALPADLGGHKIFVSSSMGIVLGSARYKNPEDVLRDADIAMYRAKRQGRGHFEVFDPVMLEGVMSRLELETDLRKALEKREFTVHYQPILNLMMHRIVGFEALARWQHPKRGLIMPGDFIKVAEETGLIVPIGYMVLQEACCQVRAWQLLYPQEPPLILNVNLSIRQCAEKDLVEKIVDILQKSQLDARCLKLELTERLIVEDSKSTWSMLSKFHELGIQVQIDDFGTGYSALGHLHALPIDTLKIDRTFISRLGTEGGGSDIVQIILSLAHGIGMKVIAEGVETNDQLSQLKAMDCEYVQGFYLARPVDSQEAGLMLEKSQAGGMD